MSSPSRQTLPAALGLALVFGCGSKDEKPKDAPSGERTKEPEPETPKDAPAGPFAQFDFDAAEASWQGSWVLEGEVAGKQVAWMIDGDVLVEFDGERERKLEFSIYSPCQVASTDPDAGVTTYKSFTFERDTLHAGLGSAGTVAGDAAIVCDGGKVYVLEGETCKVWSEMFDDWNSEPATCQIAERDGQRSFVIDDRAIGFIDDVAIGTEQMKANVATKQPNFEAAKQALASAGDE